MADGLDLSRRKFMQVGSTSLLGLSSSGTVQAQVQGSEPTEEYEFQGVADLMGPRDARPEPNSDFFDNKIYYWYRYETSDTGERFFISQDDDFWTDLTMIPTNQLNEVETQQAISFFNHTFARPESPDQKNWVFDPANVTKDNSEIELSSTASLRTTQRGNYPPGAEATPGVAFRVTDTPTAGEGFAGYTTSSDGILVGEDTTDSFVELRKGGVSKRVHRPDWNGYIPSSRVWTDRSPVITRFPHLFYGGGDLKVRAHVHGEESSELRTLHRFTPDSVADEFPEGPPIDQPNLPVIFESDSLSGGNLRANACHYQFELSESENRVNGEHFENVSVSSTEWTPLISWRKRTGWDMVNVKPLRIFANAAGNGADAKLELQLNSTVSGGTWDLPTNTSSSETSVEVNTGITLDANGERRWPGYAVSGQGGQGGEVASDNLTFNLPSTQTIVLAAQGSGGSATLSGFVAWEEYY